MARNLPGSMSLRPLLHRMRGVRMGQRVFIGDDVYLENEYPERVSIGDRTVLSIRSIIMAHTQGVGAVTIGSNVWVGPNAMIICTQGRELTIGDGAVISHGAVVGHNVAREIIIAPPRSTAIGRATYPMTGPEGFAKFVAGMHLLSSEERKAEERPEGSPGPGDTCR